MRKQFITWLFLRSQTFYTKYFKKQPAWNLSRKQLLKYPRNTLGYHLGCFLEKNGFELLPKVEKHDIYHLLTGYGTKVEDEIALQYFCFGNGKRTPYLIGVLFIGTLILPESFGYYLKSFQKGRRANKFHNLPYQIMLDTDFLELQSEVFEVEPMYLEFQSINV